MKTISLATAVWLGAASGFFAPQPVRAQSGSGGDPLPVISITASAPETSEPAPNIRVRPGEFTITRAGDTAEDLNLFLEFTGTATADSDYASIPQFHLLPAGQTTLTLRVEPLDDTAVEGDETVVATLREPPAGALPNYRISPDQHEAEVVIHDTDLTVVRIEATGRIAEETSFPFRRIRFNGEFLISRTGPTRGSLPVYVQYSGSATPGTDYAAPAWMVTIPAGENSIAVPIEAVVDNMPEPIETVVATLSNCPPPTDPPMGPPCYAFEIEPAHSQATIFIRDDGITRASLDITRPAEGAHFTVGEPILIEAVAIDLEGYINRIEFWDGEQRIGVSEIFFVRAPDPGTPIQHSFEWLEAAPGPHRLTARVRDITGALLTSLPVQITVGARPERVVLEVEASDPVATELGPDNRPDPAVFTIHRAGGPSAVAVMVFYTLDGTARNGIDYAELSGQVLLPANADRVDLVVQPVPDKALEGDETVVVRLAPPICIEIFPPPPECYLIGAHGEARAIIRDQPPSQPPRLAITHPANGAEFPPNTPVEIAVETIDPDGYVERMEFFADDHKIGEQILRFLRPPHPGQPQTFSFTWNHPTPGGHALTARATDNSGQSTQSEPVRIRIVPPDIIPIVSIFAPDPFAVEPAAGTPPEERNQATFRVRRFGPTDEDLVVAYALRGSAENGIDYERLSGQAVIPAGQRSALIQVAPLADDQDEFIEVVVAELAPAPTTGTDAPAYRLGWPRRAAALISDPSWRPPRPRAHCLPLRAGGWHICFAAETGRFYRIETTTDFRRWETVHEATAEDGVVHFVDENADSRGQRFYRLTPEPAGAALE